MSNAITSAKQAKAQRSVTGCDRMYGRSVTEPLAIFSLSQIQGEVVHHIRLSGKKRENVAVWLPSDEADLPSYTLLSAVLTA